MPRARRRAASAQLVPVKFDKATSERLRQICSDPDFEEWVEFLATHFRPAKSLRLSDAAILARLVDVADRARDLSDRLGQLPTPVRAMLEPASVGAGATANLPDDARRMLDMLAEAASRARRPLRPRRGPTEKVIERLAVAEVRNAFQRFGIPFKPGYDASSKGENPAEVVLRIVLGLKDDHRIDRYLTPPRRSR